MRRMVVRVWLVGMMVCPIAGTVGSAAWGQPDPGPGGGTMVSNYPAYQDVMRTWRAGLDLTGVTPSSGSLMAKSYTTSEGWVLGLQDVGLRAGTYQLNRLTAPIYIQDNTVTVDDIRLVIYQPTNSTLPNPEAVKIFEMSLDTEIHDSSFILDVSLADLPLTLAAGDKTYYFGLALHRTASASPTQVGFRKLNSTAFTMGVVTELPDGITELPSPLGVWCQFETAMLISIEFKAFLRKDVVIPAASDSGQFPRYYSTPIRTDGDYWLTLRTIWILDGGALNITFKGQSGWDQTTLGTVKLDLGDVNRVEVIDGAGYSYTNALTLKGDDSDRYDLYINVRPAAGKLDVFYSNYINGQGPQGPVDIMFSSHTGMYAYEQNPNATRADVVPYSVAPPPWIELTGTYYINNNSIEGGGITLASDPVMVLGDSQSPWGRLSTYYRTAFTFEGGISYEREVFRGFIGGNCVSYDRAVPSEPHSTAGYKRYCHPSPGHGDMCEATGVLFLYSGMGVNDINFYDHRDGLIDGDAINDDNANELIGDMAERVAWILKQEAKKSNHLLVLGVIPMKQASRPVPARNKYIQQWNRALRGLAFATGAAFYDPYELVEDNQDIYIAPDGLHYTAAGAHAVAEAAAAAYESGHTCTCENCTGTVLAEYNFFQSCLSNSGVDLPTKYQDCNPLFDYDSDNDVDLTDFAQYQIQFAGSGIR